MTYFLFKLKENIFFINFPLTHTAKFSYIYKYLIYTRINNFGKRFSKKINITKKKPVKKRKL